MTTSDVQICRFGSQRLHFAEAAPAQGNNGRRADVPALSVQLIGLLRSKEQGYLPEPLFKAGEKVVVADGPFVGFEAIFQTVDAESRSMILLEMLSKPVAMRIETASLRKLG